MKRAIENTTVNIKPNVSIVLVILFRCILSLLYIRYIMNLYKNILFSKNHKIKILPRCSYMEKKHRQC